jgi:hypothetical protein
MVCATNPAPSRLVLTVNVLLPCLNTESDGRRKPSRCRLTCRDGGKREIDSSAYVPPSCHVRTGWPRRRRLCRRRPGSEQGLSIRRRSSAVMAAAAAIETGATGFCISAIPSAAVFRYQLLKYSPFGAGPIARQVFRRTLRFRAFRVYSSYKRRHILASGGFRECRPPKCTVWCARCDRTRILAVSDKADGD